MQNAAECQKQQMKSLDIDKFEDLQYDIADMLDDQQEVMEIMGRSYNVEFDENEIMEELNELDEEIVNEQLADPLHPA